MIECEGVYERRKVEREREIESISYSLLELTSYHIVAPLHNSIIIINRVRIIISTSLYLVTHFDME